MSIRFLIILAVVVMVFGAYSEADESGAINVGDTVRITVLGEADQSRQVVVDEAGCISLPLAKDIRIAGMTASEAADAVAKALSKYLKSPDVTVEMVQKARRQVTITGQVKTPGVYPIESATRLMEVVGLAGGFTEAADTSKIIVTRRGAAEPVNCDIGTFLAGSSQDANVILKEGDVILVPEKSPVYGIVFVYGAVRQPGQPIQLREGMRLSQAVSAAGGIIPEQADMTKCSIKRKDASETMNVDLAKALSGDPAADVVLQSGDIITVPTFEQLGTFTIYGAVANPGEFPIKGRTTLSKALATAGANAQAKISDIRITRSTRDKASQIVKVDLTKVNDGQQSDPEIQPGDAIYVPDKGSRPDRARWIAIGISLLGLFLGR